jgi:hypothetical protein
MNNLRNYSNCIPVLRHHAASLQMHHIHDFVACQIAIELYKTTCFNDYHKQTFIDLFITDLVFRRNIIKLVILSESKRNLQLTHVNDQEVSSQVVVEEKKVPEDEHDVITLDSNVVEVATVSTMNTLDCEVSLNEDYQEHLNDRQIEKVNSKRLKRAVSQCDSKSKKKRVRYFRTVRIISNNNINFYMKRTVAYRSIPLTLNDDMYGWQDDNNPMTILSKECGSYLVDKVVIEMDPEVESPMECGYIITKWNLNDGDLSNDMLDILRVGGSSGKMCYYYPGSLRQKFRATVNLKKFLDPHSANFEGRDRQQPVSKYYISLIVVNPTNKDIKVSYKIIKRYRWLGERICDNLNIQELEKNPRYKYMFEYNKEEFRKPDVGYTIEEYKKKVIENLVKKKAKEKEERSREFGNRVTLLSMLNGENSLLEISSNTTMISKLDF